MTKQIGWFILKEDTVFTNTFECAAWYEMVSVKAGRYPMMVIDYKETDTECGREIESGNINMVSVDLPGVVTSDEFGARFCGMPIGNYDNNKNRGKKSSHHFQAYLYSVAQSILGIKSTCCDSKYKYELLPEYEPRAIKFIYLGEEGTTYGIFVKENLQ